MFIKLIVIYFCVFSINKNVGETICNNGCLNSKESVLLKHNLTYKTDNSSVNWNFLKNGKNNNLTDVKLLQIINYTTENLTQSRTTTITTNNNNNSVDDERERRSSYEEGKLIFFWFK